MRKRIISFTIVIVLMLSLLMTGCSEGEILKMAGIKQKWIASDIAGTVTAETDVRLQDDYAAAVNKDWILAHSDGRGASTMLEVLTNVLKKKRTLLEDTTVTGKGQGQTGMGTCKKVYRRNRGNKRYGKSLCLDL